MSEIEGEAHIASMDFLYEEECGAGTGYAEEARVLVGGFELELKGLDDATPSYHSLIASSQNHGPKNLYRELRGSHARAHKLLM